MTGDGPIFLLKDTGQESLLAARYRLADFAIEVAETKFSIAGEEYPRRFLDSRSARTRRPPSGKNLLDAIRATSDELGLDFTSVATAPEVKHHTEKAPRIGLWVPWADTDSIGWIRYSLDQRKVPYTYLRDEDIRAGALRNGIDVLLYGHVDLELAEQIQGLPKAWGPMPFKKSAKFPSLGTPAESDDITGGIGWEGLAQIQKFVEDGGLMVTLGSGTMLALEGGIVRGVRRSSGGVPRSSQGGGTGAAAAAQNAATRTPGAHVRVTFDRPDSPIAYGYPSRTYVFRQNFPLYDAPRRWLRMAYCTTCLDGPEDRSGIVMEWGDREGAPFVVSGQAWGEDRLITPPSHPRSAGRPRPRHRFQLQPDPSRPESRRPAPSVERPAELARDSRRTGTATRAERDIRERRRIAIRPCYCQDSRANWNTISPRNANRCMSEDS